MCPDLLLKYGMIRSVRQLWDLPASAAPLLELEAQHPLWDVGSWYGSVRGTLASEGNRLLIASNIPAALLQGGGVGGSEAPKEAFKEESV